MECDLYEEVFSTSDKKPDEDEYVYRGRFVEKDELPPSKEDGEVVEDVAKSDEKQPEYSSPDRPMWKTKKDESSGEEELEEVVLDEEKKGAADGETRKRSRSSGSEDEIETKRTSRYSSERNEKPKDRSRSHHSDSSERERDRRSRSNSSKSRNRRSRSRQSKRRVIRAQAVTIAHQRIVIAMIAEIVRIVPIVVDRVILEGYPRKSTKSRASRSSSRGTYEGFEFIVPDDELPYSCRQCRRGFFTIRELSEHEIRMHDNEIECTQCDKRSVSVSKLAAHILHRHPTKPVLCYYCYEKFGHEAQKLSEKRWQQFRDHVYREIIKKRMYKNSARHSSSSQNDSQNSIALRGVGRCPHGAPVKCKNFPNCPGVKCIYSHGLCRFNNSCTKTGCPFDHDNRPRVCMSCVNDMKDERRRRY
ncbi:unnamed protein product [Caenorhabditis bovis]|uniref:C2H2-type domain-containing protein n=1 Tax=Caenorhabditis bovis TaxID=2654633 RepID=A0A8S1EJK2_9PELO|nr:unnamed protein product [Caenorhabditis bovis]